MEMHRKHIGECLYCDCVSHSSLDGWSTKKKVHFFTTYTFYAGLKTSYKSFSELQGWFQYCQPLTTHDADLLLQLNPLMRGFKPSSNELSWRFNKQTNHYLFLNGVLGLFMFIWYMRSIPIIIEVGAPPVRSWFKNHSKYRYIYHTP